MGWGIMPGMRTLPHPSRNDIALSAVLHALSDPTRLQIVRRLAAGGESACWVFDTALAKPKSTLSHHFKVLREAGVTRTRVEGTQRLISLRREDLDARFPGLLEALLQASEPF